MSTEPARLLWPWILAPAVLLIWNTILPLTFQSCHLAGLNQTLFLYESSPLSLSIKWWDFISFLIPCHSQSCCLLASVSKSMVFVLIARRHSFSPG